MTSHNLLISKVRASVTDRRAVNVRYRQNQLNRLYASVCERSTDIHNALQEDFNVTQTEAVAEFSQTLRSIRNAYTTLDNSAARREEYSITEGRSNPRRRVPKGLLLLRASTFSRFYSVLQPLSVAISTGNCMLIELNALNLAIDLILQDLIRTSLDPDAYVVVETTVSASDLPYDTHVIDQSNPPSTPLLAGLTSPTGQNIAVVDRTADIENAAFHIANAKLLFHGASPYAPDLVLVNEFVMKRFADELVKCIFSSLTRRTDKSIELCHQGASRRFMDASKKGECSILHASSATVVEVVNRNSPLLHGKITGPCIVLLRTRSLTDAANLMANMGPVLTCFHFGDNGTAKFLSQAANACGTFVNHIPWSLLIGPSGPSGYPLSTEDRYTSEMLTIPQPEYLSTITGTLVEVTQAIQQNQANLRPQHVEPLPPTGQGSGTSIGFFEQGILTGLATIVLPVLAVTGFITYTGGRLVLEHMLKAL